MSGLSFIEGLQVEYKNNRGFIKFIDECGIYLTVCMGDNLESSRDICLVVYSYEWDNIKIIKKSVK